MAPADPPGTVQYDEGRADFPVDEELGLDQGDLSRFLLTHSMHLVTEFNSQVSGAGGQVRVGAEDGRRAQEQPTSTTCPRRRPVRSITVFFNDISEENNLTFILKIPTRLTGIQSVFVMESPSLPSLSSARTCPHPHSRAHTQAAPGRPLQGAPGSTVLPVELR